MLLGIASIAAIWWITAPENRRFRLLPLLLRISVIVNGALMLLISCDWLRGTNALEYMSILLATISAHLALIVTFYIYTIALAKRLPHRALMYFGQLLGILHFLVVSFFAWIPLAQFVISRIFPIRMPFLSFYYRPPQIVFWIPVAAAVVYTIWLAISNFASDAADPPDFREIPAVVDKTITSLLADQRLSHIILDLFSLTQFVIRKV